MLALLLLVSLCLAIGRTNCPKGWFAVKTDSQRCCKSCPEGARMVAACTANETTKCSPCQIGEYMHPATLICVSCTKCSEGYGVISDCVLNKDTDCQECPQGTFSNISSNTERCQKCSASCPSGYSEAKNCTKDHDTVCITSRKTSTVAYDQSTTPSHIEVNTRMSTTKSSQEKRKFNEILIGAIVPSLFVIILIVFVLLCYWKEVLCFRPDVAPANHRRNSRRGLIATHKAHEPVKQGDPEEGTSL